MSRKAAIGLSVMLLSTSCASAVTIAKWRPDDGEGVISAHMLGGQSAPGDMQVRQARAIMKERCGELAPHVVEEGTSVSKELMVGIYGGGTYDSSTYYWIVKCDPPEAK